MNYWLLKTDPETYAFADLQRDRRTTWDGVSNPQALIYLRSMKKGDAALIYHSGKDKCIMGSARLVSDGYVDPKDKAGKLAVVDIECGPAAKTLVTLAAIKADPAFAEFALVRHSRLSVMPVEPALWKKLCGLAGLSSK